MGTFEKIFWGVIAFVFCCYLIKWGVELLSSVAGPLVIILGVTVGGIALIRLIKWRNDHHDY